MKFKAPLFLAAALLTLATSHTVLSGDDDTPELKIGPSLATSLESPRLRDVIVIMQDQANLNAASFLATKEARGRYVVGALRKQARSTQKDLIEFLESNSLQYQSFYIANMIAVDDVNADMIQEIASRPDVRKVIANPAIRQDMTPVRFTDEGEEKRLGIGENIKSTGAGEVWASTTRGKGIVVAGQDTGVQWDHPALKRQYRGTNGDEVDHSYSWHDAIRKPISGGQNPCGYDIKAPCDDDQHGTHTMGTIVGDDGQGNQVGMAPDAEWIACRNMDAGVGRPSTYIECFEFFLAPYPQGEDASKGDPSKAPHVINNSWGCPASELCEGNEFLPVLEALNQAGIMVVVSAGNNGPSCGTIDDQPATHSALTLSVGAHNHRNGKIAGFSSRGPSAFDGQTGPDITAPGVDIRSTIPGGGYAGAMWSGTSMAGPHVVGAVALLWSAQPELVGDLAKTTELLTSTAIPTTSTQTCGSVAGDQIPNNTFGYGIMNVQAAVEKALHSQNE